MSFPVIYVPLLIPSVDQGCQMVYFQAKNPNLGKFWMAIWNTLQTLGIFYGRLVHFSGIGIMYQEKSGIPAVDIDVECIS
jgi:hypothetical protein